MSTLLPFSMLHNAWSALIGSYIFVMATLGRLSSEVAMRLMLLTFAVPLTVGCSPTGTYELHTTTNATVAWRLNNETGELDFCQLTLVQQAASVTCTPAGF